MNAMSAMLTSMFLWYVLNVNLKINGCNLTFSLRMKRKKSPIAYLMV